MLTSCLLSYFPVHISSMAGILESDVNSGASSDALVRAASLLQQSETAGPVQALLTEATQQAGLRSDEARLLQACACLMHGDASAAHDLALATLRFVEGDRALLTMTHLVLGLTYLEQGQPDLSFEACSRAYTWAGSPAARHLRVPALCLWAAACLRLNDPEQATARSRRARRLARTSRDLYLAHSTLALSLLSLDAYESLEQIRFAEDHAQTALEQEHLRTLDRQVLLALRGSGQPHAALSPRPLRVELLAGCALWVRGRRIPADRTPRVPLLLAYLIQHPGVLLSEAAERLLPEVSPHARHHDEMHRVARLRQTVNVARDLIGDPGAVLCQAARLHLSARYAWESDLTECLARQEAPGSRLPPGIHCDWIDSLNFTLDSGPG